MSYPLSDSAVTYIFQSSFLNLQCWTAAVR